MFSVLGMAGSLRRRSYNRALLRAAAKLAPAGVEVEVFELGELPLYNADLDETRGGGPYPEPVAALREKVIAADALLLAVPEYNWGPSGVIKNAVDWVSRPSGKSPLAYKPVALMGASPGPAGTGRGQLQLRQNLLATSSLILPRPLVHLGDCKRRFDDDLELSDEEAHGLLGELLTELKAWGERVGG